MVEIGDAVQPATGGTAPGEPPRAAFFDLDNTIMHGASIFQMARGLYQRRLLTWRDIAHFAWQQINFLLLGENLDHVADIEAKALSFVEGYRVTELRAIGEEIYDELMADKIWPGPYALAREHMAAGHQVWLVTATPVEVAEVIARRLELTGALGTVAEIVDGAYTGRLVGGIMHGQAKADAVRALAEREGIDLADCSAYSDSTNDLPMLSLVGRPVAVNPDAALRAHARANGWTIRDFRTGRKAARIGVPATLLTGMAVGAAMGALAVRRRRTPVASR
ncbi:MAG: HAD-IB family hydrolase [Kineosporiaceae bacterium]